MHPLLIGIDEAGYGPILGPLVVSAAAFEVPATQLDRSLWAACKSSVALRPRPRERRLIIADSKQVYKRRRGLADLERTVLAALALHADRHAAADAELHAARLPPALRDALGLVAPHVIGDLGAYPWYREANPALPLAADAGGIRIAGTRWARDAAAQQVRLAGVWSEPLLEGHFNRLIARTNNKSVVLMGLTLRLVQRVAEAYPDRELYFWIDKHGGRDHYRDVLMQAFDGRELKIVDEGAALSTYVLRGEPRPWQVHFCMEGESRQLPVALASMVSKYLREAFMACFNDWWTGQAAHVRPTAGYYEDGLRFIRDIEPLAKSLMIRRDMLVRAR